MLKLILPLTSLLLLPHSPLSPPMSWHITALSLMLISTLILASALSPNLAPLTLTPMFTIDTMSACLIILSTWISSLMILASYKTLLSKNAPKLMCLTITSLTLTLTISFSMNNFMLFYIFFETSLIPTLMLILMWGYQPERLQASMYLMLYTVTASLPLLMSLILIYFNANTLSMLLSPWPAPFTSLTLSSIWWPISIMAFLVKMPLFFFHLWLPKAHVEAPIAGSMILAAILLKLGSYGLIRLMSMMPSSSKPIIPILISISLWGAIITSLICLRQSDLKALIAYSSVGHMGIMTAGLMSSYLWGWYGSLLLMLSHGLCSSAMFMLANMTYDQTNTRSMFLTKGLISIFPSITTWWFLFSIANMAAPPTMNLLGEIFLLTSIIAKSLSSTSMIASISFLTAAYSLHLYTSSQHGPIPSFSNPMSTYSTSSYTPLFLHFSPLILLIAKADTITHWIS